MRVRICFILIGIISQVFGTRIVENNVKGGNDASQLFPVFDTNCGYMVKDFILLSRAISSTLNFFSENLNSLIMDAGVGTRILERQIALILDSNRTLSDRVYQFLKKLIKRGNDISETIVNQVRKEFNVANQTGREKIKNTLPWITSKRLWKTPEIGHWNNVELEAMNDNSRVSYGTFANEMEVLREDKSDSCIGEIFGGCNISAPCQNEFLKAPHSKYSLTHQVIFMHIYEQICDGNMLSVPQNYSETLCSRVFSEARTISEQEYPKAFHDLFAEQIVVCSLAGYEDFLSVGWMYKLLFWQKQIGSQMSCFSNPDKTSEENELGRTKRKKREGNFVDYETTECSVHFSAVGVGGLAMYLRHFLERCVPH